MTVIQAASGIQVTVCHTYLCMHLAAASIFLSVILILNQEQRKLCRYGDAIFGEVDIQL